MTTNSPDDKTVKAGQEKPAGGLLSFLRPAALVAALVGAVGSVGLTLRAGRSSPRVLMVLFFFWVLAPFVALAWANLVSKRWTVLTQTTLHCLTLLIALVSLAIYGSVILPPVGAPRAFVFVVVPPLSLSLTAIVVPLAALISRKRAPRA